MPFNLMSCLLKVLSNDGLCSVINQIRRYLKDFVPELDYKNPFIVISERKRTMLLNEVSELLENALINGATISELVRIVKYGFVVSNARKMGFDHELARRDMSIDTLINKYVEN